MSNGVLTQETVVREDPYTEAYKRGLFESVFGLVNQQMGFEQVPTGQYDAAGNPIVETRPIMDASGRPVGPAYAPPQQVAGMSPMQQQARALLQENLGAGQDYLRGGLGSVMRGGQLYEQAAQQATGTSPADPYGFQQRAATAIEGGMEAFDPSGIEAFFNPYEEQVVQQVQTDFDRARRMQEAQQAAQAVGSGAFGGSRAAIAEQEAMRNLNQAELNALGQLRQQGFGAAMTAAQNAQENQQRRALTGGSYLGNLGSTFGQLGQRDVELLGNLGRGIADLGGMQADLGVTATNLMRGDVSALSSLGGQDQMQQQNILDAIRQTNVERQQFPFQQFGYLSDVLNRVPTNESTMQTNTSPQQSGIGQAIGYGIAGLGALAGVA